MNKTHALLISALLLSSSIMAFVSIPPGADAVQLTPVPTIVRGNTNTKESISLGASIDGRIFMAWSERIDGNLEVMFSYSSNNGTSFTPATRVNSESAGAQRGSQLATSNDTLYITWEDGSVDSGDIILSRSENGGTTFEEIHVSDFESGPQYNPSIAASGEKVAIAWEEHRSDNTIRLWNGMNGNLVREIIGHQGAVRDMEFSPDGAYIASGSEDNLVKIWNASTGALVRNITSHTNKVLAVNWSSDGSMLATGSFDYNVTIYNTTDFSEITRLNSTGGTLTKNYVNAVSFSPDSGHIAAAYNGQYGAGTPSGNPTMNYNITVWNLTDYSSWTQQHTSSVFDISYSNNGTYVASGSKDTTLKIRNSATGVLVRNFNMTMPVQAISWSPDDMFIAAGLSNGSIAIVNVSDESDISWMKSTHTGGVHSVDWSTGDEIISGASDPKAKIWFKESDSYYGFERENLTGHMNSVYSVDWSSDGLSAVTAGGTSTQYNMGENQVFCAVSDDGGRTFSSPALVSDSCARNRFRPKVGIDSLGVISVVWYDTRGGSSAIYFANSSDLGASFDTNVGIDTVSTDCAIPKILVDAAGTVHVVWQYGLGAGIRYANSSDSFANSRIIATTAQEPRIAGSPAGSSLWIGWRWQNTTTKLNCTSAAISYNGGASFAENILLNSSKSFINGHALLVDRYNQTNVAWEIGGSIYHRSTVLSDDWGPWVESTSPKDGDTGISIFTPFIIRFSEPMNRDVTEAAFSWTNGTHTWYVGDCLGNKGTWNTYGNAVTFQPKNPLQYQKSSYSFRIASTASDLAGNILGVNMTFSFTTGADTDPPTIVHFPSQYNVSYDMPYYVMAVVRDQWGTVDNVRLFYQGVDDAAPTTSVEMSNTGSDIYQGIIPAQQSLGSIYYYITATDGFGNAAWNPINYTNHTQLYNVSVVDGVKPEISHIPVMEADVFREIEVWAVVTDSIQLQSVWLNYRAIGSMTYTQVPMVANTSNTFSYPIPAQSSIGMVHYNITALDTSGNFNSTDSNSVQILDRTAPLINSVTPELLSNNTKVLVRANVTDDVGIGSVTLYFKAVGGDAWVSRPMTLVSGDIYEFTIPPQRRSGEIYYYVNATDTTGNQASTLAEQDQFQIEVVGIGTDNTLYYVLGAVLILLMVILVFLLVKRFSKPDTSSPDDGPEEILGDGPEEEMPPSKETGENIPQEGVPEKVDGSP
ncbi:MAG: Ig-like domain-containing protein [Candidatus Thermoplasmatota archaeon]|nr:hypothetical protein [Euryarchaeota archaeon]MBU4032190.1 Ig-like domain-containing protein [Candidatus Thermoplasmatota archaeon]MBU4071966.1 Ig-like domain-containing protein [Candidatus Thermoplasmatota archaeon]MBU4143922.1 Ig-like domain-containing protein [Candidatus Thermoplasmatota archaeon]MBU4591674.1 Ig-like domain-containing protein [Candidatus Thermoplasmatota archaeon]